MRSVMRWSAWLMAAVFFGAFAAAVLAQEAPPAKPEAPKGPGPEQWAKLGQLQMRVNRMIVEAAQANPELKAMHEAQIAKNRALEEKRREVIGNTPELKAIQDEIMAKRKEIGELERKIFAGLKDNPDLQKLRAESDTAWNELAKKASENNPELGKAIEELEAAKKAARPPAEKPEKKEQPKE